MKLKMAAVAVYALLSGGCASTLTVPAEESVKNTEKVLAGALDAARAGAPVTTAAPVKQAPSVRRINATWVPVAKVNENEYRAGTMLNRNVVVNRNITDLTEAAAYITQLTGVPVYVSGLRQNTQGQYAIPPAQNDAPPTTTPPVIPGLDSGLSYGPSHQGAIRTSQLITYSGKLSGLFDVLAAKYGMYWEPEGDGVRFFMTKSRTFRLLALPGNSSMTSFIGTNTSGSGGGGGEGADSASSSSSEQRSGIAFDGLSVWQAVDDAIKAMLSPNGKVVVTPATGTVTVDDEPPVLERVAKYIDEQNAALSRQVVINVRVLAVDLNDSDSYGVNWNAVYQNLGAGFSAELNTLSGLPGTDNTLALNIIKPTSMWNGTNAIIEALSKQGRVSQITSASIVTINNQPAPIQVGRQRSYLASSTTTIGSGGAGNTTTLTPGVVTTGFSMSVLPHILDNGSLMLQFSGDISSLVDITTVSSGESSIQTPEVDTRNFLQRVIMKNGETLALTGFEQNQISGSKQGIGSANNVALGGSVRASNNKTVLVVLIQPVMAIGGEH